MNSSRSDPLVAISPPRQSRPESRSHPSARSVVTLQPDPVSLPSDPQTCHPGPRSRHPGPLPCHPGLRAGISDQRRPL